MKILLDTHVWLWAILEPSKLGKRAAAVLEDGENELWVSAISAWEISLLASNGRIELDAPVGEWIERELGSFPLRDIPIRRDIAIESNLVTLPNRDPADRFIVATAVLDGLILLSADNMLLQSGACQVMSAAKLRT